MATLVKNLNLVFIHIPKNGGTSVSRWLRNNIGGEKGTIKHGGIQHIQEDWPDILAPKTFAIVRNPWARMISLYHFSGIKCKQEIDKGNNEYVKQYKQYLKGFDYWLYNGLDYRSNWFSYKQNQSKWITHDPTWLLRLENIAEDFKIIQNFTNCFKPLSKENTSVHKHYSHYYNSSTKNYVAELFYEDIKRFNYDF